VDRVVAIRDGKTSTEMIREEGGERGDEGGEAGDLASPRSPLFSEYVVLDSAGRLQVPREYLEQLGIDQRATLEPTGEGILIRPAAGRRPVVAPLLNGLEDEEPPARQGKGLRAWWARRRG
jgi:hypothetical protein